MGYVKLLKALFVYITPAINFVQVLTILNWD